MSARRILMLGAPGVGKGTQAARLVESLSVPHVSTGEMLRSAVSAETPVGLKAKSAMEAGQLVSDELVIAIAEERLSEGDAATGFILDGFPRTQVQAEALDAMLARTDRSLQCCLVLTVPRDEVVTRLLQRAEIEGRSDDTAETIQKRMRVYEEQTAPLVEHYRPLVREVNGKGSVDEVSSRVEQALEAA